MEQMEAVSSTSVSAGALAVPCASLEGAGEHEDDAVEEDSNKKNNPLSSLYNMEYNNMQGAHFWLGSHGNKVALAGLQMA